MEDFGRSNSFMEDPSDLGLGENFFEDNSDLGRVFEEEDGANRGASAEVKSKPKEGAGQDPVADVTSGPIPNNPNNSKEVQGSKEERDAGSGSNTKGEEKEVDQDVVDEKGEEENDDDDANEAAEDKRRNSNSGMGDSDAMGPPPLWHNDDVDRPHRDAMIREIAKLLKARKKNAPTKEWMQQLPHKARVLEDRLYKKAHSLDAYLDRSTLKNRLRTLAVTITAHYKKSGKDRKGSNKRATTEAPEIMGNRPESMTSNGAAVSSQANPIDAPVIGSSGQTSEDALPQMSSPQLGSDDQVVAPDIAMNELARQKQVNEDLQKQIMENIRQQQQLVSSIRRGSNASQSGMNPNGSSSNAPGSDMTPSSGNPAANRNQHGDRSHDMAEQMKQNARQRQSISENQMDGMQASQFSNGRSGAMNRRGSNAAGMGDPSFDSQTSLMRQASASNASGSGFNAAQMAMMRRQSGSMSNAVDMNMQQQQSMQAAMMRRNSNAGHQNMGGAAQFQAQQAAMMQSSSQAQNQAAAQMQMQAALMSSNQFNMAQAQAAMMAAGANPMNPQAQAALMRQMAANPMNGQSANPSQAALMQASLGNNPPNLPHGMMNGMANQAMMGAGMPNGQMMAAFANNQQMLQNAGMMSMNGMGMPQNMAQFASMQQQMGMGPAMMGMGGNDGNFPNGMNFQAKKGGGNMGVESQNSFNW